MANRDTDIIPGPGDFPSTHGSMVVRARDPSVPEYHESLHKLLTAYGRPVYVYIRAAWSKSNEDAKDLTQEFLSRLLESDFLQGYDRERGRFRFYLKGALRHFLLDQNKSDHRRVRGGDRVIVSMDADPPPLPVEEGTPEELFDREWAQTLLDVTLEEARLHLQNEKRSVAWKVFDLYELHPPESGELSVREAAERLKISEPEARGHLKYVRLLVRDALQRRKCRARSRSSSARRWRRSRSAGTRAPRHWRTISIVT